MSKSLKKLSRRELLELLLKVTESNEALVAENAKLREGSQMRLTQATKVGSIAEAALEANGYFEAVQRSADDYLREVKELRDQMVARHGEYMREQGGKAQAAADRAAQEQSLDSIQAQAKAYIQDVQTYANNVIARANAQAESITANAQAQANEIVSQATGHARSMLQQADAQAADRARVVLEQANAQAQAITGQAEAQAHDIVEQAKAEAQVAAKQAAQVVAPLPVSRADTTGPILSRGRHARALA